MVCQQRQRPAHQLLDNNVVTNKKMDNLEIEKNTMPVGEGTAQPQQPVEMPVPAPMQPQQPVEMPTPAPVQPQPVAEAPIITPVDMAPPVMQQPQVLEPVVNTIVTPMETTMQPIDLSGQGMQMQGGIPEEGGKKKIIIIIAVIVAGLLVGLGAFLFWRTTNAPTPEVAPIVEDATPVIEIQEMQPIAAPEADDVSVIEQDLNAFNIGGIDAELQGELNVINAAL